MTGDLDPQSQPGILESLPGPIQKALLATIRELVGVGLRIPLSILERYNRSIQDTTLNRTLVANALAEKVAEIAANDPEIVSAALEAYTPTVVRKTVNRNRIAQRTIELANQPSANFSNSEAPDPDWMNAFIRFAEDASSERLQDLFARILSGQIARPSSFSMATLRTVSELDQSIAEDFTLAWAESVGDAIINRPLYDSGEWFMRLKRLSEAGLMSSTGHKQSPPPYNPSPLMGGYAAWSPFPCDTHKLFIFYSNTIYESFALRSFTRVGREIGSILPPPNYKRNLSDAAVPLFQRPGIERIEIHGPERVEVLYTKP